MSSLFMHLKILLPSQIFAELDGVSRIVVETSAGFFGILPHRLDGIAAMVPGIFMYEIGAEGETYIAVDQGMLVKAGREVLVSVRRAIGGKDLGQLKTAMEQEFLTLDESEQSVRTATENLESGFLSRLARAHRE